DPMAGYLVDQAEALAEQYEELEAPERETLPAIVEPTLNPNSIFLADEFDVETLRAQGVPILDMSRRAQQAYDRAIGHLNIALESDPRQRRVYDLLMEIYSLKGEYDKALQMLSQMYVFFPESAELWTYLGYAHYKAGNMEPASKAFETAFKYMTPEERHAYESLDVILPEEEKKQYEQDALAYASRFWTSKDPRYLTSYNERKLEHYARLTYADLLYASDDLDIRGWNTERGQILVRYGVPKGDVVIIPRSTTGINRSAAPKTPSEQDRTGSVGLALNTLREGTDTDLLEEANTYNIWDYGDFKFVFEDPFRNGEYRLYSPSAAEIADGALPWVNDYTIKARETFRETPERYDYEAPGRQIELPYLVSSFRGRDGMTDVYVNYGIPVSDQYDPDEDIINLTAKTGIFIVGEDRNILVEQRPTLYGLKTNQVVQFEESNIWVDSKAVTSPPGHHEVSVEFETASSSTVAVQRRKVEILDFTGDQLAMSDLMLAYRIEESFDGRPVVPSDIVRKGYSMQPAPWSVFSVDQPIYLYFEVYNLETDANGVANYEVEAVLVPKRDRGGVAGAIGRLFGGGDEGVSVTVPASIEARDDGQYLILDASNQEPGLYTLAVRVTDTQTGRRVERDQDLFLE
ncbi:MAG: GWxTD domain-containing protein, partial [Rhodothermales bacterium]|nr:GWxTD domain-containing protein [Rhodothermales bacterium]